MIEQIDISNFRSIKNQSIPLKRINVLYGPNGSGKSSVMYAPYVVRNFFVTPNQRLDSLLNLGFINLGGVENVLFGHNPNNIITISITAGLNKIFEFVDPSMETTIFKYTFEIDEILGPEIKFSFGNTRETIPLNFPYSLSQKKEIDIKGVKLLWNGLTFEHISNGTPLAFVFNSVYEIIKNIEIISVKRGFFSPIFSTEQPNEESEFALTIRQQEKDFESKIDHYFKKIFEKTFRFVAIPGSTSFYLRTQNNKGFTIDLVNEGFGVNQTVYMLIKLLKKSTSLAFIEEPEIHLHPSAQNKLVDVFADISKNEGKQIFITTHSENIVSGFLRKIADGELSVNDIQFYLAQSEGGETTITPQNVNDKGQLEGGLLSFMEAELKNLKSLLGL